MKVTLIIDGHEVTADGIANKPKFQVSPEVRETALKVQESITAYLEAGDKTSKVLRVARLNALMRQLNRLLDGSQSDRLGDVPEATLTNPSTQTEGNMPLPLRHNFEN